MKENIYDAIIKNLLRYGLAPGLPLCSCLEVGKKAAENGSSLLGIPLRSLAQCLYNQHRFLLCYHLHAKNPTCSLGSELLLPSRRPGAMAGPTWPLITKAVIVGNRLIQNSTTRERVTKKSKKTLPKKRYLG